MHTITLNERPIIFGSESDQCNQEQLGSSVYFMRSAWAGTGGFLMPALAIGVFDAIWVEGMSDERLAELKLCMFTRTAGGGVVTNEYDELLMIKRNGVWDLPKGKWELGETMADCALREVFEETGLHGITLDRKCLITYHIYLEKESWILKENHWFTMRAKKQALVPQTEEGIEEAVWVPREAISKHLLNTYVSIKNVLHVVGLI